jgi:ABC-type transporter lipoprotein component MlaA
MRDVDSIAIRGFITMPRSPLILAGAALALACSSPAPTRNWESYAGPERERFLKEETELPRIGDPSEPYNRTMSAMNHGLIIGILDPLSSGWRSITSTGVRQATDNFVTNLRWPLHTFANLAQGEWAGAGRETARFGVNLTAGFLGFVDRATEWGIEPAAKDFGHVFDDWGWNHSSYFVLPFFGPKTVRETCAFPFDLALNLVTYVPGAGTVQTINNGAEKLPAYHRFVASQYDPYQRGRLVYLLDREWRSSHYEMVASTDRSVETLGAVYLSNRDPEFPGRGETHSVAIAASGKELPYDLWLRPEPAPIVCILPGLGGHRVSGSAYGLAEMAWRAGYSALTLSNAMNWEFIQKGASTDVPGFAVQDAKDVHHALGAGIADIERRNPGRVTEKALLGISMGAFHTLLIASAEGSADAAQSALPAFDAYAVLNPPVRFEVGLNRLDQFFNAPMEVPASRRGLWVDALLGKVVDLVNRGAAEPGNLLPFSKMEAEFLIGLAFRGTLNEIIISSQDRHDQGVLKTPRSSSRTAAAWQEATDYSYREYMLAFAFPHYFHRDPTITSADELLARCDARRYSDELRANQKVFVFTNRNDFLLEEQDLQWLETTFGPRRLMIESEGSHLGNLYQPEVQDRILDKLGETLRASRR